MIISEPEFRERLREVLYPLRKSVRSVTGPGRSGAVAAVYASHFLGVPYLNPAFYPRSSLLHPVLVVDTAINTGRTLRQLGRTMRSEHLVAFYHEPPRVRFWYEV